MKMNDIADVIYQGRESHCFPLYTMPMITYFAKDIRLSGDFQCLRKLDSMVETGNLPSSKFIRTMFLSIFSLFTNTINPLFTHT